MRRLEFFESAFDLTPFSLLRLLRQRPLRLVMLGLVNGMLGIEL